MPHYAKLVKGQNYFLGTTTFRAGQDPVEISEETFAYLKDNPQFELSTEGSAASVNTPPADAPTEEAIHKYADAHTKIELGALIPDGVDLEQFKSKVEMARYILTNK